MRTSLKTRTFRLRAGGVECDADGLRVAGAQLLESVGVSSAVRNWRPLAQPEIDRILGRAYDARICASDMRRGLAAVAEALNKGELARAQIAALLLRLPDPVLSKLDPDARAEELACLSESGLLAKDWEEGSSAYGDAAESGVVRAERRLWRRARGRPSVWRGRKPSEQGVRLCRRIDRHAL